MFKFQFLLILLFYFFLFFKYFVVPQHSYFRIKVSEWWRNVDYCFICFEMHDSHDVQREQFSTSVPRGFTLLYHVVGQVISGWQLCVDQFKAYSHPFPGIWTFKDFFFPLGNVGDRNFLHVNQVLKPTPCRPFLLSHLLAKVNYNPFPFPFPPPYLKMYCNVLLRWKDFTPLVQIPHPHQARFRFPTPPGPDEGQMTRLDLGGGGGDVDASIDRWFRCGTKTQSNIILSCFPAL